MRRVLVVEDEYQVALDLAAQLRKLGCDVQLANGPDSAMELVRKRAPQIAFIDINLRGGFEGLDLAGEIASETNAEIVFVTGYSIFDLYRRMPRHGPSMTIFKPVNSHALELVLNASRAARRWSMASRTRH